MGAFLVRQRYKFLEFCLCCLVISAIAVWFSAYINVECGGVADLARFVSRAVCICERSIRKAEQPQSKLPKT